MTSNEIISNTKWLRIIFYCVVMIYILYFVYDIFLGSEKLSRYLWAIYALFPILIPFYFERIAHVYIPWTIKIFLILSLLIHAIGEFQRYYYLYPNFDVISHLISSIAIASLVCLFIIFVLLYYGLEWKRSKIMFIIILMTVIFGLFYEWLEIFSDMYFGSKFSWELRDSTADIMVDSLGAILVAWYTNNYLKERTMRTVASDFLVPEIDGHYKLQWAILPEGATPRSNASSSSIKCHSTEDSDEGR